MTRLPLLVIAALTLPAVHLSAQTVQPISSSIRHGGTFHVATGTWTRTSDAVSLGNDILYNNTCPTGSFAGLDGGSITDEGRIPGPFSPSSLSSATGCAISYAIDGFQIGYCSDLPTTSLTYSFFDDYTDCTSTVGLTPLASIALAGLPGSSSGIASCWTINVDLSATTFIVSAGATNPLFGFTISSPQMGPNHGPLIAGDPNACSRFDGTSWQPVIDLIEAGTGMSSTNHFFFEGSQTPSGCHFFSGLPLSSFWLEMYGTTCAPDAAGQAAFCSAGQVGVSACPCGNNPALSAGTGCLNSFGSGGLLSGSGLPSLSVDTVVLGGSQMPSNSPVLYFQGTLQMNSGIGTAFGDGLRCAGGQVTRLGTTINSVLGASQYPSGAQPSVSVRGGVMAPGSRTYQAWYRNAASFCTPAGFNTTNGWQIYWGV